MTPPGGPPGTFGELVALIIDMISATIIPILITLVLIVIAWRTIDAFIINAADEPKRQEGKRVVVAGVIVMTVLIAVWGIVILIRDGLGFVL